MPTAREAQPPPTRDDVGTVAMLAGTAVSALSVLAYQPMVMVGQQAVSDDADFQIQADLLKQAQEIKVVFFFEEDRMATSASVVDVVEVTLGKVYFSARHVVFFTFLTFPEAPSFREGGW